MHSIILIERYLPFSIFWPNLLKDKKVTGLSVEEILSKYQGFEGELKGDGRRPVFLPYKHAKGRWLYLAQSKKHNGRQ